jgi:formylglycine-generating enzyme required for sulfatase activity
MAGNVWEWVTDGYVDSYYKNSPSSNPVGPDPEDVAVLRGGAWPFDGLHVRSAYRGKYDPAMTGDKFGFRCARSVSP